MSSALPRRTPSPEPERALPLRASRLTGIGSALRTAREARGISYVDAERETHIPRHNLQALEEEHFDAFPARVYVCGFLRSYSHFLNLNGSELVALLPPEGPVDEERLLPLSRLGRPRGPREAARARRSPVERDAPPLTESMLQASAAAQAAESASVSQGRMRLPLDATLLHGARSAQRLDPLGRLGWPEQHGAAARPPVPGGRLDAAQAAMSQPDEAPAAGSPRDTLSYESPLIPRQSRSQRMSSDRPAIELPDDIRAVFSRRALTGIAIVAGALILLYAIVLAAGGRDASPSVLATNNLAGVPAAAPTVAPAAPALAAGQMPNLRGQDLQTAVGSLHQQGIVPIVIQETASGTQAGQVIAQMPAAGVNLQSNTPVLLVAAQ